MSVDLGDAKVTWTLINWLTGGLTAAYGYVLFLIRGKVGKEQFSEFKESIKSFKEENNRRHGRAPHPHPSP